MEENKNKLKADDSYQHLASLVASNLRTLISQQATTQKDLAEKTGVAPASMSDYCNGRRIPNVEFFVTLKNIYNISIDDFLTRPISSLPQAGPEWQSPPDRNMLTSYEKHCGIYYVYYFDTSKYKGSDTLSPRAAVVYGLLYIYNNESTLDPDDFRCAAVLGVKDRKKVRALKKTLDELKDSSSILQYIGKHFPNTYYYGDMDLLRDHACISLRHPDTDRATLILNRIDNTKSCYIGGIGTINSISKGRERTPVIQYMGISRYPLSMSVEEIHHSLLLGHPDFKAEYEAEEIIKDFKALYLDNDKTGEELSEYQKHIIIRSTLERFLKKSLERNIFRYGKVSDKDDDEWYHTLKDRAILEKGQTEELSEDFD